MRLYRSLWTVVAIQIVCAVNNAPAQTPVGQIDDPARIGRSDNLPDPLTTRQLELKARAVEANAVHIR
jgi:hypothetical protein